MKSDRKNIILISKILLDLTTERRWWKKKILPNARYVLKKFPYSTAFQWTQDFLYEVFLFGKQIWVLIPDSVSLDSQKWNTMQYEW